MNGLWGCGLRVGDVHLPANERWVVYNTQTASQCHSDRLSAELFLSVPIPPNPNSNPQSPHRSRKQTVRILSAEVGEQLTVQVGRYTGMVCATTIHQSLNHTTTTHHHPHSPTPSAHNLPTTDRRLQAVQTSRLSQSLRPPSGTVAAQQPQQAAQLSCTVEV